jgi:hypothetical protein
MQHDNSHYQHHIGHFLLLSGVFLFALSVFFVSPVSSNVSNAFGVKEIIDQSNEARSRFNLEPLQVDNKLMGAAQAKAEDMARLRYFEHIAPDGTTAWDYMKKYDYYYVVAGENLAITNQSTQNVINGWLNSTTHRDNLLSDTYRQFGIGMATYGDYKEHKNTYVITAFYGAADGTQLAGAPTNPSGTLNSGFFSYQLMNIPVGMAALFAGLLITAGVVFEARHLRRIHASHKPV